MFLVWDLPLCPLLFQCDDSMSSSGVNVSVNINSHQLLQSFMCANIHGKCRAGAANSSTQSSFEQNHEEDCGRCLYLFSLSEHLLGEWDSPKADTIINGTQDLYVLAEFHNSFQAVRKNI